MNVLFVCSANQQRSPTAEHMYQRDRRFRTRSAGTNPYANIPLNRETLIWADAVIVMEKSHMKQIREDFADIAWRKRIYSLDIPDRFEYMDPRLKREIRDRFERLYRTHLAAV